MRRFTQTLTRMCMLCMCSHVCIYKQTHVANAPAALLAAATDLSDHGKGPAGMSLDEGYDATVKWINTAGREGMMEKLRQRFPGAALRCVRKDDGKEVDGDGPTGLCGAGTVPVVAEQMYVRETIHAYDRDYGSGKYSVSAMDALWGNNDDGLTTILQSAYRQDSNGYTADQQGDTSNPWLWKDQNNCKLKDGACAGGRHIDMSMCNTHAIATRIDMLLGNTHAIACITTAKAAWTSQADHGAFSTTHAAHGRWLCLAAATPAVGPRALLRSIPVCLPSGRSQNLPSPPITPRSQPPDRVGSAQDHTHCCAQPHIMRLCREHPPLGLGRAEVRVARPPRSLPAPAAACAGARACNSDRSAAVTHMHERSAGGRPCVFSKMAPLRASSVLQRTARLVVTAARSSRPAKHANRARRANNTRTHARAQAPPDPHGPRRCRRRGRRVRGGGQGRQSTHSRYSQDPERRQRRARAAGPPGSHSQRHLQPAA